MAADIVSLMRHLGHELRSAPIHCGHHQAEQAPEEFAEALLSFLG